MLIKTIEDLVIKFVVWVIAHKFYQLNQLNNVSCVVVDMGYKLVKNDHNYDLAKLQGIQLVENLGEIRKAKKNLAYLVLLSFVYFSIGYVASVYLLF